MLIAIISFVFGLYVGYNFKKGVAWIEETFKKADKTIPDDRSPYGAPLSFEEWNRKFGND